MHKKVFQISWSCEFELKNKCVILTHNYVINQNTPFPSLTPLQIYLPYSNTLAFITLIKHMKPISTSEF